MIKKTAIALFLVLLTTANFSNAKEPYVYGAAKYWNYGLEKSDLQTINTSLVNLGFSSSSSSTDNWGIGYEFGIGYDVTDNFAIEGGYVDFGTLTIKTNTTGPTENITTDITGNAFSANLKAKFGSNDDHFFGRAGIHTWDLNSAVTSSLGKSTDPLGSGTDPWFGVGYQSGMFNVSYDYYKLGSSDITSITGGIKYTF
jgi:hypothetical protein